MATLQPAAGLWDAYEGPSGGPMQCFSPWNTGPLTTLGPSGVANTAWPAAKLAIYTPFTIYRAATVTSVWWIEGGTSTNSIDLGVYTISGARLGSTGLINSGTINVLNTTTITPIALQPGTYYMAMSCTNITNVVQVAAAAGIPLSALKLLGMAQEDLSAGTGALQATATFATVSNIYIPWCGLASVSVV